MLKAFLPVTLSKVDSGVHVVTAVQLEYDGVLLDQYRLLAWITKNQHA